MLKTIKLKIYGIWTEPIPLGKYDNIQVPFEKVEAVEIVEEITLKEALEVYPTHFRDELNPKEH